MYKIVLLTLIIIYTSCNNSNSPGSASSNSSKHADSIASVMHTTSTIINQFDTPEFLLDCYYKAWEEGNLEQIAACFGSNSTVGFSYRKTPGINYRIFSKEKFQDSILSYIYNGSYQSEGIWVNPEFLISVEDSIDFIPGHTLYYYWIGKNDVSWIIMDNCSEVETQMEDDIMKASDNADRMMDSIANIKSKIKK